MGRARKQLINTVKGFGCVMGNLPDLLSRSRDKPVLLTVVAKGFKCVREDVLTYMQEHSEEEVDDLLCSLDEYTLRLYEELLWLCDYSFVDGATSIDRSASMSASLLCAFLAREHPDIFDYSSMSESKPIDVGFDTASYLRGDHMWRTVCKTSLYATPEAVSMFEKLAGREYDVLKLNIDVSRYDNFYYMAMLALLTEAFGKYRTRMESVQADLEKTVRRMNNANTRERERVTKLQQDLERTRALVKTGTPTEVRTEYVENISQDELEELVQENVRLHAFIDAHNLAPKAEQAETEDIGVDIELPTVSVNINDYKVIIVGNTEYAQRYPCDYVDLARKPELCKRLYYADLIVVDSVGTHHKDYYLARSVARKANKPLRYIKNRNRDMIKELICQYLAEEFGDAI